MDISWGCGWFLAALFVFINLVGQLGGVAMVLLRLKVSTVHPHPLLSSHLRMFSYLG